MRRELNSSAQLELSPQSAVHSPDQDVAWFEHILHLGRDWQTANEILAATLRTPTENNRRWLRGIAERSWLVLSGPGSPGYKHLAHCTPEEIAHCSNAMISQGKDMIRRGIKLRRAAHALVG